MGCLCHIDCGLSLVVFWLSFGCLCHIRIVGCVSTGWWLPASAPPRLRAWARGSAQPKPNPSPSLNPQSAKSQKQKQRNRVGSSQVQQNDPVLRGLKENRPIIFSPSPPKLISFLRYGCYLAQAGSLLKCPTIQGHMLRMSVVPRDNIQDQKCQIAKLSGSQIKS